MSMNKWPEWSGLISSNLGYPRIGGSREWKKALERFWNGSIDEKRTACRDEKVAPGASAQAAGQRN